ncbi:hypothetical protein Natpe_2597 [Natrinema pellirubrum DSM 15624]|uniref:Uncharacterized protein n=1 Tax=Natrinema pellirubrum (strain DSM 15624 / CIP 106293 / JCM 10476 / NCIMB 786 / 157) TaxID=797303 RepID=L0JLL1_NATP1|nr:hypothetical protein Natpe_2597 [Natrinema pellirubrum DSM 15624]
MSNDDEDRREQKREQARESLLSGGERVSKGRQRDRDDD